MSSFLVQRAVAFSILYMQAVKAAHMNAAPAEAMRVPWKWSAAPCDPLSSISVMAYPNKSISELIVAITSGGACCEIKLDARR